MASLLAAATLLSTGAAPAPPHTSTGVLDQQDVPLEQNDAGSGRDAGATWATAIPVERRVEYDATLLPGETEYVPTGDWDWFSFSAVAGERIDVELLGVHLLFVPNCLEVYDESGTRIATSGCGEVLSFTAPADGRYAVAFGYFAVAPTDYTFIIAPLDEDRGVDYSTDAQLMRPDPSEPTVVVAVVDTGVNPYHEAYSRPLLTEHPCTWVAGFDDCSIPALELSLGQYDTYAEAYEADRDLWQGLAPEQWYWIPGTNIIGAVCDGTATVPGPPPWVGEPAAPCIHDASGHGTAVTSSILSEAPNALLLVRQSDTDETAITTAPVVPDIQSQSRTPSAPMPMHAADPVTGPTSTQADPGPADPETLFFISAGNMLLLPSIADSRRVHPSIQVVGGGFPGKATTESWTMFDFASWLCRPTADHRSQTGVRRSSCATNYAAPTVAGAAAAALLELRRGEGHLGRTTSEQMTPLVSRDEFVTALRRAATYDAEQRFPNDHGLLGGEVPLVPGQEHYAWGYGWLDATRVDAIVACATGGDCPAKSADAERWNEARQELRRRQTEPLM